MILRRRVEICIWQHVKMHRLQYTLDKSENVDQLWKLELTLL